MLLKQRNDKKIPANQRESYDSIAVGSELYGYCGGAFGRDSYSTKVVISKNPTEIVAKNEKGKTEIARICDWNDLVESSNRWLEENEEDEAVGWFEI